MLKVHFGQQQRRHRPRWTTHLSPHLRCRRHNLPPHQAMSTGATIAGGIQHPNTDNLTSRARRPWANNTPHRLGPSRPFIRLLITTAATMPNHIDIATSKPFHRSIPTHHLILQTAQSVGHLSMGVHPYTAPSQNPGSLNCASLHSRHPSTSGPFN